MIDSTAHAALVTAAGPTFAWDGIPSSRPSSDIRSGLFAFLADYAGGTCAFCGDSLGEGWQACHIVSGGKGRRGYLPGNLAAGCADCNDADRDAGEVVALATIMRPDLVPSAWPTNAELIALGKARKVAAEARRAAKRARRGM
jgi:hypothetical protein